MRQAPSSARGTFVPASSKLEAVTRLSAVTRSGPESLGPGSKERKSTLTNLARGLHLLVDHNLAKPAFGAALARQLDVTWTAACWSSGQTITLLGLNRLLEGAEEHARRVGFDWHAQAFHLEEVDPQKRFRPASTKIEAVQRMAALTGSQAQTLGPGSKERKSVFLDLAAGLQIAVEPNLTKPQLGGAIAQALNVPWDPRCWSTSSTVTLEGLNRLLFASERALGQWDQAWADGIDVEAAAILGVLANAVHGSWDGRSCIQQMRLAECRNWAQDEWAGFYFEFIGLPALINAFGGGPIRVGNTIFDYRGLHTWDLKFHSIGDGSQRAILNDAAAIQVAVDEGGIGFVVLAGDVEFDPDFRDWQRQYRLEHGRVARPRAAQTRYIRRSKSVVHPREIDAVWLSGQSDLHRATSEKIIGTMNQGQQVSGQARKPKFLLDLARAQESWLHIGHRDLKLKETGQGLL